jgi:hypothetical protein
VNEAATTLVWFSHGFEPKFGFSDIPDEALDSEEFEDVKLSMWKIAYPYLYVNK